MPSVHLACATGATIPSNPNKGSYNALDLGLATSALGSQSNFGRVLFDNSTYYTFHKKWVLARSTQIGIEKPYGTNDFIVLPPNSSCRWKRRRFRCRNCSSPAAAIRCADSPSTRRARAIPRPDTLSADRGCSSITWSCARRRAAARTWATNRFRVLSRHGQRLRHARIKSSAGWCASISRRLRRCATAGQQDALQLQL